MTIQPGSQLGAYTILASLAPAGSAPEEGARWRARDTRQERKVAIWAVPAEIAGDPERRAKAEGVARTLAALDHAGVARVFGLEDADGTAFLVSELVEGETLADRLKQGARPVPEGLGFAHEIARALEAAHERGILHRDLTPSSIRVTPGGGIKTTDVGLLDLLGGDDIAPGSDRHLSHSPTLGATAVAQSGSLSGTSAYLAPERARSEATDTRAGADAVGGDYSTGTRSRSSSIQFSTTVIRGRSASRISVRSAGNSMRNRPSGRTS